MKNIVIHIIIFLSVVAVKAGNPDKIVKLNPQDLFVLIEYKQVQYEYFENNRGKLPSDMSFLNYYVDINGKADSSSLIDVNYLYLNGYNENKTEGEVYYLVTKKNRPMSNRNSNIRNASTVDHFYDIGSIINVVMGYWKKGKDNRVFIAFRDQTKIWNMRNFRIFGGLIIKQNIYITTTMNTKDDYLFDYNFKRNKEIKVELPIHLDDVFYSVDVENKEDAKCLKEITQTEKNKDSTFKATIKYWQYDSTNKKDFNERGVYLMNYDSLNIQLISKRKHGAKKRFLFVAYKNCTPQYSSISVKRYKNYFNENNQKEYLFIRVIDPYDNIAGDTKKKEKLVVFNVPYSGENLIPRILNFFKKKIINM
ncbi:MAG: hypothetical protein SFY56_15020 [Bacteroidota bacterium]|nr:hypothetical protein [Bacteroidota bacterium]